jgi:hypothetical protein
MFNLKVLIDTQTKTNKHLKLIIKFTANIEIAPANHLALTDTSVRTDLFHFSANFLP